VSNYAVPEIDDEITCWFVAMHPDVHFRAFAAASQYADENVMGLLLADQNLMVVKAAIHNPVLPRTETIAGVLKENDAIVQKAIIALTPPDRETLLWLYHNAGDGVRNLALNYIFDDKTFVVRCVRDGLLSESTLRPFLWSEKNKRFTEEDLKVFARSSSESAIMYAARNTKSRELLTELSNHESMEQARIADKRIKDMASQPKSVFG
jgi:hypothetical protein